jgi:hypothetical protein
LRRSGSRRPRRGDRTCVEDPGRSAGRSGGDPAVEEGVAILEQVFRDEAVVAALIGLFGNFDLVEEAAQEVIICNSTTYGINLLAQGLPLEAGDEILLIDGDFPATEYPWLPLRGRGVRVRFFRLAAA